MSKQQLGLKQTSTELGVTTKWVRARIAEGVISPQRVGSKRNGRFVISPAELETLRAMVAATESPLERSTTHENALARIAQLEEDRANLLAQVAWARAIAKEQHKALESQTERVQALASEVELQRARVEALKALSALDRLLGRHKAV